jgi:hypothetical protein
MKRELSMYEIAGIMGPGIIFIIVIYILFPDLTSHLGNEPITIGLFGIILMLSYIVGHVVQAIGNILIKPFWKLIGDEPKYWIINKKSKNLLNEKQTKLLKSRFENELEIQLPNDITEISKSDWDSYNRSIFVSVNKLDNTSQANVFLADFGLFRGLATALILGLLISIMLYGLEYWIYQVLTLLIICLSGYRMLQFAKYHIRELYLLLIYRPKD